MATEINISMTIADEVLVKKKTHGKPIPCGLCSKPVRVDRIIRLRNAGIPLICCSECGSRPVERGGIDHRRGEGARIAKHNSRADKSAAQYLLDIREHVTKARAACDRAIDGVGHILVTHPEKKEASTQTEGERVQVLQPDTNETERRCTNMLRMHPSNACSCQGVFDGYMGGGVADVFYE